MGFVRQASAAAILVTMTLWLQSAGMAVLIDWAKACIGRGVQGMGHWRTLDCFKPGFRQKLLPSRPYPVAIHRSRMAR